MSQPMPLQLLHDEVAIDRSLASSRSVLKTLTPLSATVTAGFALHALSIAIVASATEGLAIGTQQGGAWFLASTIGFFAAIGASVPSVWFFGVVARIPTPSWRLAAELVRIQAVGAVTFASLLPVWLALTLGLLTLGAPLQGWITVSLALPFACALPGVFGLYRVFRRMSGGPRWNAALLTAWWVVLFTFAAWPLIIRIYLGFAP